MMQSKMWSVLLKWLTQLASMDVIYAVAIVAVVDVVAVDVGGGVEDAFEISIRAHANRGNYFHMLECYLAYIPMYFANDECS